MGMSLQAISTAQSVVKEEVKVCEDEVIVLRKENAKFILTDMLSSY